MFNNDVLFVGYGVKNIKSLPQEVDDLTAIYPGDADGNLVLKWTSPTIRIGRQEIEKFVIYKEGIGRVGSVTNTGAGKEHTFAIDVSEYTEATASFYIICYTANVVGSLPSNAVECILTLSEAQVKKLINKAISDLNIGIDSLEAAIDKKANIADLTKAIEEITSAYEEADKLMASDIEGIKIDIANLSDALSEAQQALNEAIDVVQQNLDKAIDELNKAISDGDSDLSGRIEDLSAALVAAKTALEKADSDNKAELEKAVSDAEKVLQAAIKKVQDDLEQAKKDLENAIENNAEDFQKMIEALKKAMELADSTFNSTLEELRNKHNADLEALCKEKDNDIAGLRAELAELKTLVDENKTEADANIEKLSSVDTTQKDHMEGLQTVSYIGLGIAGVSFVANIVLLAQMLMKKRKPFVK